MDIHIIPCLKDNYAYIVENKETKNACDVDPSESEPVVNFLKKNKNQIIKSKDSSFFLKKIKEFGAKKIDYLSAFDLKKLKKTNKPSVNTRVFLAYYLNNVRLIDNF